jgi:hypothetical protein
LAEQALNILVAAGGARGVIDEPVFRDRVATAQLDVAHLTNACTRYIGMVVRGESRPRRVDPQDLGDRGVRPRCRPDHRGSIACAMAETSWQRYSRASEARGAGVRFDAAWRAALPGGDCPINDPRTFDLIGS